MISSLTKPLSKCALILSLALLTWIGAATNVQAKDFQADYNVEYSLNPTTQLMHVKQNISLTNKEPNLRASSYSLTLETNSYKNLSATDSKGKLAYTEKETDGNTAISFTFNDKVAGTGNKLRWTIEYDSTTLAKKNGQMWDIAIPRIKEHDSYDIASYNAVLITPLSLGEAHYITPKTAAISTNATSRRYTFTKDQVMPTGIVAAFGSAQIFKFSLSYHLYNRNISQASVEIALPPDIPGYQQIIYDQLNPSPVKLRSDSDGNALATYYLAPQASLDVTFTGWARIDQKDPKLDSQDLASSLPQELVKNYTVKQKYWETDNADLIAKTKEITDPAKPVIDNARAIYAYVTSTLKYNNGRINENLSRLGAAQAFKEPTNAVCMEFTDLFVTMARIAGIPAREVDGYAYTAGNDAQPIFYPGLGSDILHAWAQIYLPGDGWVMVDPTWGSTTGGVDYFGRIDLNRVAFAIKGLSSERPFAAGSYKTDASQDGDVKVNFSSQDKTGQAAFDIAFDKATAIAGISTSLPIKISNTGNVTAYQISAVTSTTQPLTTKDQNSLSLARLLPGETATTWLAVSTPNWLDQTKSDLTISLSGADFYQQPVTANKTQAISVEPILTAVIAPIALIIITIALLIGGAWYGLHWYHQRQQTSDPPTPKS